MIHRPLRRRTLMTALAAATLAAAVPAGASAAEAVDLGVLRLTSHAPSFIAYERGYFRDEGLDVTMQFFEAAQPMSVAVAAGDVDYGMTAITGGLITRYGVRRIIVAGACLTAASVAVALTGKTFPHFITGLVLLGVGWNFMFVGATTLLSTAYAPHERVRAQAANDFIVFGTVACTAFLSGFVHAKLGWNALNLTLLPPLAVALGLLAWQRIQRGRATQPATP